MSIQNFSIRFSWPKLICSLPVLLVTLYFIPPIGVILTIARLFIYGSYRYYRVPGAILVVALLCLVPRGYELLQQNFGEGIPVIQPLIDFRLHPLYAKLTDFGRWVAVFSLIMIIASILLGKIATAVSGALRMGRMAKVFGDDTPKTDGKSTLTHDNPAKHQTDQTTPHVVKCPHCSKANHIIGTVGTCKACRSAIEWTGPKAAKK